MGGQYAAALFQMGHFKRRRCRGCSREFYLRAFRRDGLASKDAGTNNASVSPSHIITSLYIYKYINIEGIFIKYVHFSIKIQTPDVHLVEPHLVFRMPPPEPHGLWIVVPWHVLYKQQLQRRLQLHTQKKTYNRRTGTTCRPEAPALKPGVFHLAPLAGSRRHL